MQKIKLKKIVGNLLDKLRKFPLIHTRVNIEQKEVKPGFS